MPINHTGFASQMPSPGTPGSTYTTTDTQCVYTDDGNQWNFTSSSALLIATITLTAAQIKTLHTAPIQLVPAPGAGKYIQFYDAQFYLTYGGVAFDVTGKGVLQIYYGSNNSLTVVDDRWPGDTSDSPVLALTANGGFVGLVPQGGLGYVLPLATADNQPLNLALETANLTTGNSTLKVKVRYEIKATAL